MRKYLLSLVSIILFSAMSASADDLKKITILQTADIHSRTGTDSLPGLRQLAAALDSARKKAGGDDKCLLIDCGDILQGSFAGACSKGAVGLGFLNDLKYDAWIPGNHDFDFGTDRFLEIMQECSPTIIAANLLVGGKRPAHAWKIIEKDSVRIALIGLTTPSLDRWHWGPICEGLGAIGIDDVLDEMIPKIMDSKCDMIILAVHQGMFQNDSNDSNLNRITEKYPQIDLVLGAHSHQGVPGEIIGISSWYSQAEAYCASFSRIVAEIDVRRHRTTKIESMLIPVPANSDSSFKFSRGLENLLSKSREEGGKELVFLKNEIVADELNRMTADAYLMSAPSAASALMIPQERTINAGKFTEEDLYWTFPFEDTVCTISLSEPELATVMDEAAKLKDNTRFILVGGEGRRVEGARRMIVLSSYLLAGAGGRVTSLAKFAGNPTCRASDTGVTLRDAFRKYLKHHGAGVPPAK